MVTPVPAIVFGVGGAGSAVLETLSRRGGAGGENRLYYVFDTDEQTLRSLPRDVRTRHLAGSSDYASLDTEQYPFLNERFQCNRKTSDGQRSIGRYRIDNREPPGYTQIHTALYRAVERCLEQTVLNPSTPSPEAVKVFLIHSLAGGTGSGAFPLLGAMLSRICDWMAIRFNVRFEQIGVALCPRVAPFLLKKETGYPGHSAFYPNTYGALYDLAHLLTREEKRIPVYAGLARWNSNTGEQFTWGSKTPSITHGGTMFDQYYLFGVDEKRRESGGENEYNTRLHARIATAIDTITHSGPSSVNSSAETEPARVGSVGRRVVAFPTALCQGVNPATKMDNSGDVISPLLRRTQITTDSDQLLTDPPNYRSGTLLPVTTEGETRICDIDLETSSLTALIEEGIVDRRTFKDALRTELRYCRNWVEPVVKPAARADVSPDREHRIRYHERNQSLVEQSLPDDPRVMMQTSADSNIGYIDDPYLIQYLVFYGGSPVETTQSYQALDRACRVGELDRLSPFNDYRASFAYPEWYGKEIRDWYDAEVTVTVSRPPEPCPDSVSAERQDRADFIEKGGLVAYLWEGTDRNQYRVSEDAPFDGWSDPLSNAGLLRSDVDAAKPPLCVIKEWMSGETAWATVLERVQRHLTARTGVELQYASAT